MGLEGYSDEGVGNGIRAERCRLLSIHGLPLQED